LPTHSRIPYRVSNSPFASIRSCSTLKRKNESILTCVCVAISVVNSFHPSAQQNTEAFMNVELDVEKKLQAAVVKDRIRIKEFFIDFDKLRKGTVGEAAVSIFCLLKPNFIFAVTLYDYSHFEFSSVPASAYLTSVSTMERSINSSLSTSKAMVW